MLSYIPIVYVLLIRAIYIKNYKKYKNLMGSLCIAEFYRVLGNGNQILSFYHKDRLSQWCFPFELKKNLKYLIT